MANEFFPEAADFWDLNRLFADLSAAKKRSEKFSSKGLSEVEQLYLQGVLARCSPTEIATRRHVSSGTVRSCLSDRIYPCIKLLVEQIAGTTPTIKHWSHVAPLLEALGYRRRLYSEEATGLQSHWVGVPEVDALFGREAALALLEQWIVADGQRVVHLTGAEGIGKTALAVTLALALERDHRYAVLWLSMESAPTPATLVDTIQRLWGDPAAAPAATLGDLLGTLPPTPWIVILDAMESVVEQSKFLPAYRSYSELLRQLCEVAHQGCVLLTSSEKIGHLSLWENRGLPVKSLRLEGLSQTSTEQLLHHLKVEFGQCRGGEKIRQIYGGNPQFIRLLAATVHDLFGGNLATLIQLDTVFLGEPMQDLLALQWQRLSPVEQQLARLLAAAEAPLSAQAIESGLHDWTTGHDWINGLQRLRERLLIEVMVGPTPEQIHYALQPTAKRYLSDYLNAEDELQTS